MKLIFMNAGDKNTWTIQEKGKDTKTVSYEHLGLIFKDELGIHWNIYEDYSGIIELEELKQIVEFMELNKDALQKENE